MGAGQGRLLVGRDAELGKLIAAYDAARTGSPTVVVIQGEAGIGKTRLVRELADRVTDRVEEVDGSDVVPVVATGHAVDLAGGAIPFGLVAALLDDLVLEVGPETARELLGTRAAAVAALIPSLGEESAGEVDRLQVYGAIQHLLATLARRTTVVLFAEDAHWADPQSRDVLTFIARSVTRGSMLLVLTTRPVAGVEEAAAVVELGHLPHGQLITLGPLSAAAVRTQIDSSGVVLPHSGRQRIVELSEGVPLYVEELIAAVGEDLPAPHVVPAGLRVNLAARAGTLPAPASTVLDAAAVHDHPFTVAQVAALLEESETEVAAAFDRAIYAGVLDALPHGRYRFHHALIRAALAESLPPSARTTWHRRWAVILGRGPTAQRPETVIAVAHHLFQAGASADAVAACRLAAAASESLGAPAEAVTQWRRVLDMLTARPDLMPDGEREATYDEALAAIRTGLGVDWPEVRRMVLAELDKRPRAAGVRAVFLWLLEIASARQLHLPIAPPPVSRLRESLATLEEAPASLIVAVAAENLVRVTVAHHPEERGLRGAGLDLLARSSSGAGSQRMRMASMVEEWLGWIDSREGNWDAALARMEQLADQPDNDSAATVYYEALVAAFLTDLGRLSEAVQSGLRTLERIPHPTADASWPYLTFHLAKAYRLLGDWDRASQLHEQLAPTGSWLTQTIYLKEEQACLAFDRGDTVAAEDLLKRMQAQIPDPEETTLELWMWVGLPLVAGLVADRAGNGDEAANQLARILTDDDLAAASADAWPSVVLAAQIAWRHPPSDPAWRAYVANARDRMYRRGPIGEAWFHDVEANLARAEDRETPEAWRKAVDAWHQVGAVHYEAVCRLRLAEALLHDNAQRQAAGSELSEALAVADRLGAVPLADEIHSVAGRARLTLGHPAEAWPGAAPAPVSSTRRPGPRRTNGAKGNGRVRGAGALTQRELDVLAQLAEGKTNDQIGRALYMSPKTASVHVSRIIDKLGAANRTQVVSLAHRAGLLEDPVQRERHER